MTSANAIDQAAADGEAASALDVVQGGNRIFLGATGDPPKDQAKTFALVSLVIMAVAAVAAPVTAAIVFFAS